MRPICIAGFLLLVCWQAAAQSAQPVDADWYDAEQLKPYESKGVPISMQEGDRKTVQLTVIEAESAPQARP